MSREALVVFGREPVPGRVKTRLAKQIGAQAACEVYRELLGMTLKSAARVDAERYLDLPDGDRLLLHDLPQEGFNLRTQKGADLGARMHHAFASCFDAGHRQVILVGSDCPYLDADLLARALSMLGDHQTVLGPALDGGYYLVGQRNRARDLFSKIPWSTDRVWELTMQRLKQSNWTCGVLPELEDVDDLPSYRRYLNRQA